MVVKTSSYNIEGQVDSYVSNLKLGHYTKIPTIASFRSQLAMVLIQIFVRLGVLNRSIQNLEDYCQPNQSARFTCPDAITCYNASVIWGTIGPKRIFEKCLPHNEMVLINRCPS
ncbi:OPT oligopeptide transporter protein-domain-containing protein [Zygosaccharomyces rouxii]|nr:OPT oligopeptide transporter protein-domain-containing protein [Zygosaccharomyces rouxii]